MVPFSSNLDRTIANARPYIIDIANKNTDISYNQTDRQQKKQLNEYYEWQLNNLPSWYYPIDDQKQGNHNKPKRKID